MKRKAFTLIELVVVFSITSLFVFVAFNSYNQYIIQSRHDLVNKGKRQIGTIITQLVLAGNSISSSDYTPSSFYNLFGIKLPLNPYDQQSRWHISCNGNVFTVAPLDSNGRILGPEYNVNEDNPILDIVPVQLSETDLPEIGSGFSSVSSTPLAGMNLLANGNFIYGTNFWYNTFNDYHVVSGKNNDLSSSFLMLQTDTGPVAISQTVTTYGKSGDKLNLVILTSGGNPSYLSVSVSAQNKNGAYSNILNINSIVSGRIYTTSAVNFDYTTIVVSLTYNNVPDYIKLNGVLLRKAVIGE